MFSTSSATVIRTLLAMTLGLFSATAPLLAHAEPSEQVEVSGEVIVGQTAPWFALWSSQGAVINRTALAAPGRTGTIVLFFATWCEPCIAGMDALADAQLRLDAAGVEVLLINVDDDADVAEAWLVEHGITWTWLHDRFRTMAAAFGVLDAESLRLPFTAGIDNTETVRILIRNEGDDYVDVLLNALSNE